MGARQRQTCGDGGAVGLAIGRGLARGVARSDAVPFALGLLPVGVIDAVVRSSRVVPF